MNISPKTKQLLLDFKTVITTPKGWLSLALANLLWSLFWLIPLVIGFVFNDSNMYALAGAIYLFFFQPLIPMWLIIPISTFGIYKIIK
jgi:hypothetical protein